ncbi:MAG: hypothetical protein OXE04_09920 [bacterium]|nr:hypothetical protein [bacterium]
MLPQELLSLAQDLRQQASACQLAAVAVERVSRGLDDVLDHPIALHKPHVWQSAAADASRLRLHQRRSHLIRLHYDIQSIANRLYTRADELYADAYRVEIAATVTLLDGYTTYFQ